MMVVTSNMSDNRHLLHLEKMNEALLKKKSRYSNDFNIKLTQIPDSKLVTESMLAYSKKMNEIRDNRSLHHHSTQKIELPLLIKATRLPHPAKHVLRPLDKQKLSHHLTVSDRRAHSMPNMRLEPLLGNKEKYKLNTASLMGLKSITATQLRTYQRRYLNPISGKPELKGEVLDEHPEDQSKEQYSEVTQTQTASQPDDSITSAVKEASTQVTDGQLHADDSHHNLHVHVHNRISEHVMVTPVPHLKKSGSRLKKSKRMKIHRSNLESIEEQQDDSWSDRLTQTGNYNRLPLPKPLLPLPSIHSPTHEEDLVERRKDVALLKSINASSRSSRETSQASLQSMAKRKFRKVHISKTNYDADGELHPVNKDET